MKRRRPDPLKELAIPLALLGGAALLLAILGRASRPAGVFFFPLSRDTWPGFPADQSGLDFDFDRSKSVADHHHQGVDLRTKVNSRVYAPTAARVVAIKTELGPRGHRGTGAGKYVVLEHLTEPRYSWFMHLNSVGVRVGQVVRAGQTVARSGQTMFSDRNTSPHLHWEILTRWRPRHEPPGGGVIDREDPEKWARRHQMAFAG